MPRLNRVILIFALTPTLWLAALTVHELGHALAALATGGSVRQLVLYPTAFSRTDVDPNPAPRAVAWAGPLIGVALPLALCAIAYAPRMPGRGYLTLFAAVCLVLNGAYLGLGWLEPAGDPADLVRLGAPRWLLALFGIVTVPLGIYLLHRASPLLGFGPQPRPVSTRHCLIASAIAIAALTLAFAFGNPGP